MPKSTLRHPIIELSLVRMWEFLRQGEALFWVFGFPILLTVALGIAFRNTGPDKLVIGVEQSGPASTTAMDALKSAPDMKLRLLSTDESLRQLRTGQITLLVRAMSDGSYVYRFDPTRPESRVAHLAVDDALQKQSGRSNPAPTVDEKVTEPGARYIDFLLPGIVGMNLMSSSIFGLCFAVVEMRSKKLLKRLAATPMKRSHFLLSFMLSRLVFLSLEVGLVIGFAMLSFGVHMQGSWLNLAIISLIGSLAFTSLGMLIAARPTTIEGVSGWMNFVMLPMWLLSGTFFASSRFPDFAQPFIKALPLTALNDALRSVMSDGSGLGSNLLELGILAAWGIICFAVALRIFRWQ